ncbi:MAG: coproporphyrinogen III oxidase family protein, partial [Phycisphaerae bacterium]|nr:coproporphyrinogen III oxidase family protein [Phycisphaerae bacterium]
WEFTVEVNPGQVDREMLKMLHDSGVNRLSIGGQSFNDDELKLLGRRHSSTDIYLAVQEARTAGFDNINVDLIFAIPGSNVELWRRSLTKVIELNVEHVAAYSLTYEADTPFERKRVTRQIIPTGDETDRVMYDMAIDMLARADIVQYEISNFSRPDRKCQHNLTYWTNGTYIGIGPAAGSYYQEKRWTNVPDISRYITAIEAGCPTTQEVTQITPRQKAGETAVLMLRLVEGIEFNLFRQRTGYDLMELFGPVVKKNEAAGWLKVDDTAVKLTRPGLSVADSVACDFVI